MNSYQAEQVAALLNLRNALTRQYTADRVLNEAQTYVTELGPDGRVLGCVQLKRIQWYQSELCHLTVAEAAEGQGVATELVERAEAIAEQNGSRIVQCTVRIGNARSLSRFTKLGYQESVTFHNSVSGNDVVVLQKILVPSSASGVL